MPAIGFLAKTLGQYALGQVAGNLPAILAFAGTGIGSGIDKLPVPGPVKKLLKGAAAGTLMVIAHNGSSPADPSQSVVQQQLQKARASRSKGGAV